MEVEENNLEQRYDQVNEPSQGYQTSNQNRMAVFNSFEEAAEADYQFYRNLSPEQRMNIHYQLSISVFGKPQTNLSRRFSF